MRQEAGADLVARVVRSELDRAKMSQRALEKKAGVSRHIVGRVMAGSKSPEVPLPTMLRAVEGALVLPRDFLTYVLTGDKAAIESTLTADSTTEHRDRVRWVLRELGSGDARKARTG